VVDSSGGLEYLPDSPHADFFAAAIGEVVLLDTALAVRAAKLRVDHKLPLADSVMLATARACDAVLWTQDSDFAGIAGVRYLPKLRPVPQ
jgi:predicted nucleic acid-binding protein